MKTTILSLLMAVFAITATAQTRHVKPAYIYEMPEGDCSEYNTLIKAQNSRELTAQEKARLEEFEENSIFDDLYSGKCSWYCGGEVLSVKASSCLKPSGKFNYNGKNAHDFDHESVWAEGVKGQGIGEYLIYEFAPNCPRITTIKVLNGHVKSEKAWRENSRVKQLKVYYMNQPLAILDLEDSRTMQCFEVGTLGRESEKNWTLKFEIVDVYPGTKYQDTVISELCFDGIDVH